MSLRIALIAPPYFSVPPPAYGGIEAVVGDLAEGLVERGHDVFVVGAGTGGTSARHIPAWPEPQSGRLGDPLVELVHAAKVQRLLAELDVDLVHEHTVAGSLTAPLRRVPAVATVHGPVDGDLRTLYGELGTALPLVAISDRQRQLAPQLAWIDTVPNGLRLETWPFCADKEDFLLFLGRFSAEKAPHLALDAAHEAGLPLVLAGKCQEPIEKEYFAREVAPRLRDTDHVFGVADARAKRDLLRRARCLVFPVQWEEPFGMVMIEAMACGTPVVALRRGAVPEVVEDGVTGLLCDDPQELPAALARVSQLDPEDCRRHVAKHYTVERLAEGYERVYRRLLAQGHAPSYRDLPRQPGRLRLDRSASCIEA